MKSLKSIANELSLLLMSEDRDQEKINILFEELQAGGISKPVSVPTVEKGSDMANPRPGTIGIWGKQEKNGQVVYTRRPETQMEWSLWANVHEIPPKGFGKRVVLLGESVARGYFYDPVYSVARELESTLNLTGALSGAEVVDLAKTSIFIDELTGLVRSCVELEPDAIVLFAGNNWVARLGSELEESDYREMERIYAHEFFPGVKKYLEAKFERITTEFFDVLKTVSRRTNIPVVVVIPGFNLKDWKSDHAEKIMAWLPEEQLQQWQEARKQAEAALEQKDFATLETAAREMVRLDPSNPLGHELLSESLIADGRIAEAVSCLDEAKDTTIVSRGNNSKPRCFKVIRDTLKQHALREGMEVVDLFSLFAERFPDQVPGRELYLDYCHLSLKGIQLAMRYTTKALIEAINRRTVHISQIPENSSYLEPSVQAMAHFCAAIHNAHYGQGADILYYHCRQAVELDPEIQHTMFRFIDFSTRKASSIICHAFEEIILDGGVRQYEGGMALLPPKGKKLMDIALIDAMVSALESVGIDHAKAVQQLRVQEHGVGKKRLDLLEAPYRLTTYNDFITGNKTNFIQVRESDNTFHFVNSGTDDLLLDLTLRAPQGRREDNEVEVVINGVAKPVSRLPLTDSWKAHRLQIPGSWLQPGVNKLTLRWPHTFQDRHDETDGSSDSFLSALFPLSGEIYALGVRKVL